MKFEWDNKKSKSNLQKHNISFEEAKTVFYDEEALFIHDHGHSDEESRFLLLGLSSQIRELVVSHCDRIIENDVEIIRIISARKASPDERAKYWSKRRK